MRALDAERASNAPADPPPAPTSVPDELNVIGLDAARVQKRIREGRTRHAGTPELTAFDQACWGIVAEHERKDQKRRARRKRAA